MVVIDGSGFTVTCTEAVFVGSATELAETVAFWIPEPEGAGATYVIEVAACSSSDPGPVKLQDTPRPEGSFVSVAVIRTD